MAADSLARSFETIGEDYDRYRPGFPARSASVIVPEPVETALDLGAGTGKFTGLLVDRARRVIAIEPSERMLAVLRSRLPEVDGRLGAAETLALADGSVDVVAVAQAFHWFDRARACAEIARVLVPHGVLGLVWNRSDPACTWDRACHRIVHPAVADSDATTASAVAELPGFVFSTREEVSWSESITRADYVRRWTTVSSYLVAEEDDRARMLSAVERVLDETADTGGRDELELPHVTDVFVYRRA